MRQSSIYIVLVGFFAAVGLGSPCSPERSFTTTTVTKKTTSVPLHPVTTSKTTTTTTTKTTKTTTTTTKAIKTTTTTTTTTTKAKPTTTTKKTTSTPSTTVSTKKTTFSTFPSGPVSSIPPSLSPTSRSTIVSTTSITKTTAVVTTTSSLPSGYTSFSTPISGIVPIKSFTGTPLSTYSAAPNAQYTLIASYGAGCSTGPADQFGDSQNLYDGTGDSEASIAKYCLDQCIEYAPQYPGVIDCSKIYVLYTYGYTADGQWFCLPGTPPVTCDYSGFYYNYGFLYQNNTPPASSTPSKPSSSATPIPGSSFPPTMIPGSSFPPTTTVQATTTAPPTTTTTTATYPSGYTVFPEQPGLGTIPIRPFPSTVLSSYSAAPTAQYTLAASYQYGCAAPNVEGGNRQQVGYDPSGQNEVSAAKSCIDACAQYHAQYPSQTCDNALLVLLYPYSADAQWFCYINTPVKCGQSAFNIGTGFNYVNNTGTS